MGRLAGSTTTPVAFQVFSHRYKCDREKGIRKRRGGPPSVSGRKEESGGNHGAQRGDTERRTSRLFTRVYESRGGEGDTRQETSHCTSTDLRRIQGYAYRRLHGAAGHWKPIHFYSTQGASGVQPRLGRGRDISLGGLECHTEGKGISLGGLECRTERRGISLGIPDITRGCWETSQLAAGESGRASGGRGEH